jgi:hypothetical protein
MSFPDIHFSPVENCLERGRSLAFVAALRGRSPSLRLMRCGMLLPALVGCAEPDQSDAAKPQSSPPTEQLTATNVTDLPPIPRALQGCWTLVDQSHPGQQGRLTITATALTREDEGVPTRTARAELIEALEPSSIRARFEALEGGMPITVATELRVAPPHDGNPEELTLQEGDAGSYVYQRCSRRTGD